MARTGETGKDEAQRPPSGAPVTPPRGAVKGGPAAGSGDAEDGLHTESTTVKLRRRLSARLQEDQETQEQLRIYCELYGAGRTDPGAHRRHFIERFVQIYETGVNLTPGGHLYQTSEQDRGRNRARLPLWKRMLGKCVCDLTPCPYFLAPPGPASSIV